MFSNDDDNQCNKNKYIYRAISHPYLIQQQDAASASVLNIHRFVISGAAPRPHLQEEAKFTQQRQTRTKIFMPRIVTACTRIPSKSYPRHLYCKQTTQHTITINLYEPKQNALLEGPSVANMRTRDALASLQTPHKEKYCCTPSPSPCQLLL